ncbi:hypothetical protein V8E55_004885 [Tylopilus felleus]
MLALVLSCCGVRHRPHVPPDERTPLIPHSDDTPTPQPRVIDHQKLKERLCSVVRAKEGKMVNVSAQFPFNLHNQDNSSSRSSRNVSGGTLSSSRAATPSPSRKLHKSPSTASIRRDTLHYLPLVVSSTAPILNLRLVKSAPPTHTARGRSQRTGDQDSRNPALDSHPELSQDDGQTPRVPPSSTLKSHLPVNSETPPHHPEDFSIHDAGAVARSWGD